MILFTTWYCAAFITSRVLDKVHKPSFGTILAVKMRGCKFKRSPTVHMEKGSFYKTSHVAKFESPYSQLLNLCSVPLSGSELSCRPLCSSLFFLVLWLSSLLKAPASFPHSLCVFEAGEHPHTHTTTDPGSWLVLNPWQGALSLNIKDPHLRACRHDSHLGLSYSQQATWTSSSPDVAGATGGRWSDTVMSTVWAELRVLYLSPSYVNIWKSQQCAEISNRLIFPTQFLLPCRGSFPDDKSACALFITMSNHARRARRAE